MDSTLVIALLAGLGGMLGWGSADFFAKNAIDRIGPIKSLVWAHIFGTLVLLTVFLVQLITGHNGAFANNLSSWLGLAGLGSLQMVVYYLAYLGFEKGKVSILNPIFASYSGVVALIAIVFLHEKASWLSALALLLIFFANLALNMEFGAKRGRFKLTPGVIEVSAAAVLAAIWTLSWDHFVNGRDPVTSALTMYAFMTVAALLLAKFMHEAVKGTGGGVRKYLFLMGLGEAVAYLSISWGFSRTPLTGIVALVSGAFSVPTIILAYVFLKERLSRAQWLSIAGIVAGVVLLSIS